jgi:hypothetical protein
MCFSASASFIASAVLVTVGVASLKKVSRPSQILFASIPFVFGIQQLSEGVLWLSLGNPLYDTWTAIAAQVFIFFAQILWPMWVPIAILLFEKNESRRTFQKFMILAGVSVGCFLGFCLFHYGLEPAIIGHHISYFQKFPAHSKPFIVCFYALSTIAPPFFSHIKHMWLLGLLVAVSYIIAAIFYTQFVLSVWCFFSSIISVSVYFILLENARKGSKNISAL